MTKTAKDVLNDLDEWMVSTDFHQRCQLWDVLSALRGPDQLEQSYDKSSTTGWIRVCAFPKLTAQDGSPHEIIQKPASFATKGSWPALNPSIAASHFDMHIVLAWEALRNMGLTPTHPGNPSDDAG